MMQPIEPATHSEPPLCCLPSIIAPPVMPFDDRDDEAVARELRRRAAGMLNNVVDAHTHLFPESIYKALWKWFDANAWNIAFRGDAEAVLDELRRGGARRVVALVYAHKAGAAESLNRYLSELCRAHPGVVGVGTVMPGEPDASRITREAIAVHKLRGIKLHCHVQRLPIDDPRVVDVLRICESLEVPAVVHCGREPATTAYGVNPHDICHVSRAERVLQMLPRLRLVVPHVGANEYVEYLSLLDRYENLYLDTSMSCAEYFDERPSWAAVEAHAHRIMYGSDFPITPYEVDRELRMLARRIVDDTALENLLRGTARALWNV